MEDFRFNSQHEGHGGVGAGGPERLAVGDLNEGQLADALVLGAHDDGWDYRAAVGLIVGQRYWLSQDEFRSALDVYAEKDGRPVAWVRWADVELTSTASSGQVQILELARSLAGIPNTRPLSELLTGLGTALDRVVRAVEFAGQGWSPGPELSAVVLDPTEGELVDTLWDLHDWARLRALPEDADSEAIVERFADLVANLADKLQAARRTAPRLYTQDGRELASLLAVEADLRDIAPALLRARQVAYDDQLPTEALKAVDLLERCGVCSRVDTGLLASVARSGPQAKHLDAREFQAYQRFARQVLVDPLDQFQAMGVTPSPRPATEPEIPTSWPANSPEMGL